MTTQENTDVPKEELDRLKALSTRYLLLDYDGTLVPFAPRPELAIADPELRGLLTELNLHGNQVHIVTGRTRNSIESLLSDVPVRLHAEHGFWSRDEDGTWRTNATGALTSLRALRGEFEAAARSLPGAILEVKDSALTLHYRLAPRERLSEVLAQLKSTVETAGRDVEILEGMMVFEVRSRGTHKGLVVEQLRGSGVPAPSLFCIGDDRTDEDLFLAASRAAVTVKVGSGPTAARFRVRDTSAARHLLANLL
jgi:trehalose 6-phosphate synthase/phosphatase